MVEEVYEDEEFQDTAIFVHAQDCSGDTKLLSFLPNDIKLRKEAK